MNLDELKVNVDHFFEKANRYGQLGSVNVQVGVLLSCGKLVMGISNVGTNPSENLLILTPQDSLMIVPPEEEQEPLSDEEKSVVKRLTRDLKNAESMVNLLRKENKKLKAKLEKNAKKEESTYKTSTESEP